MRTRPMAAPPPSVFVARFPLVATPAMAPPFSPARAVEPAAAASAAAAFVITAAGARVVSATAAAASGGAAAWAAVSAAGAAAAAMAHPPSVRSAGAARRWRWRPAALLIFPPDLVTRADGVGQAGQLVGRPDVVP